MMAQILVKKKIKSLQRNSIYFRSRLKEKGFIVYGNHDSPVIPVIMFSPTTIAAFSRLCLEHKLAVVVVGFPATNFYHARARFCLSANHTIEDLNAAVDTIEQIGQKCMILFRKDKQPQLQLKQSTPLPTSSKSDSPPPSPMSSQFFILEDAELQCLNEKKDKIKNGKTNDLQQNHFVRLLN